MNELINLNELALKSEIQEKVSKIKNLVITPENARKNEDLRKDNNAYIKKVKSKLDEAKEEYLKPFTEQESKILAELEPLELANKEFSGAILESKKIAHREWMKKEFDLIAREDANGELPNFEDIYNPSWYNLPQSQAKENLVAALKKFAKRANTVEAIITVKCDEETFSELTKFIYEKRIRADITKMED